MNLSPKFSDRCRNLYQSLLNRSKEKKSVNTGRITKRGYELPFDRRQFSAWFLDKFGHEFGVTRCRYCQKPIDAFNCTVDHAVPLKRGGSPGLENLDAICEEDNQIKGQLTPPEYQFFLDKLAEMAVRFPGTSAVSDITSRLQKAVKLAAAMRYSIASKQRQAAKAVVQEEDF
jgi:5-methylcytosine-specific restriction endonuclease McrA